jgi:hypothetical protein
MYGVASFFTQADLKTLGEQTGYNIKNLISQSEFALPARGICR